MHNLEASTLPVVAIAPVIPNKTAATVGTGVSMAKYNNFALICLSSYEADHGTAVTFYIAESTDNSTFSTTYLATCTIASSTNAQQVDTIEVRADQLSDGYYYVRGEVTCAATSTEQRVAAAGIQFNPRFK